MVAAGVVDEAFVRHLGERFQHRTHPGGAGDRRAVGELEDEIAETEMVEDVLAQVLEQVGRLLAHELGPGRDSLQLVLHLHRLHEDRNVLIVLPDTLGEPDAGLGVELALAREADVSDDAEDVTRVPFVKLPRLLEGLRQQDLGTRANTQQPVREVDAFGHQASGLERDLGVKVRKVDGVEAGFVLDQDDGLYAPNQNVVLGVALILDLLDHRQQRLHVALPQKGPVELPARSEILEPGELPGMGGDQANR